jgi:hypothetical protein
VHSCASQATQGSGSHGRDAHRLVLGGQVLAHHGALLAGRHVAGGCRPQGEREGGGAQGSTSTSTQGAPREAGQGHHARGVQESVRGDAWPQRWCLAPEVPHVPCRRLGRARVLLPAACAALRTRALTPASACARCSTRRRHSPLFLVAGPGVGVCAMADAARQTMRITAISWRDMVAMAWREGVACGASSGAGSDRGTTVTGDECMRGGGSGAHLQPSQARERFETTCLGGEMKAWEPGVL